MNKLKKFDKELEELNSTKKNIDNYNKMIESAIQDYERTSKIDQETSIHLLNENKGLINKYNEQLVSFRTSVAEYALSLEQEINHSLNNGSGDKEYLQALEQRKDLANDWLVLIDDLVENTINVTNSLEESCKLSKSISNSSTLIKECIDHVYSLQQKIIMLEKGITFH